MGLILQVMALNPLDQRLAGRSVGAITGRRQEYLMMRATLAKLLLLSSALIMGCDRPPQNPPAHTGSTSRSDIDRGGNDANSSSRSGTAAGGIGQNPSQFEQKGTGTSR